MMTKKGRGASQVALTVESLSPHLTGIGRYTLELCRYFRFGTKIPVGFYRNGEWVADPEELLVSEHRPARRGIAQRLAQYRDRRRMRASLFHGPNYFLPDRVETGIVTVHDLSVILYPETHPIERVRHFEQLFQKTLRKASHIVTDTFHTRDEVIQVTGASPSQVTAIHLGVSDEFRLHTPEELAVALAQYGLAPQGFALCVSTIEPRKRISELLAAFRDLPADVRSRWPLVLVGGRGWRTNGIDDAIENGCREGWLYYLGYVPEHDLPAFYAAARLFLYLSTYEGFGLPPIEAMASGTPVVVSNRSCIPEVTQGAGLMVDPDDHALLVSAIARGLTDSEWRSVAKEKGLGVAASYSWSRCAQQTEALYLRMLKMVD